MTRPLVPILSAGHFNVTAKNLTAAARKLPLLFVGFSSRTCHKCIATEMQYLDASAALRALKVPFARADADVPGLRDRLAELGAPSLPQIVVYRNGVPSLYDGSHSAGALVEYARKQRSAAVTPLTSLADVRAFLGLALDDPRFLAAQRALAAEEGASLAAEEDAPVFDLAARPRGHALVVGFFEDDAGVQDEEYADFLDVANAKRASRDAYFGAVRSTSAAVARACADAGWVDRTPGVVLRRADELRTTPFAAATLDTIEDGLALWVDRESLPLVGELTPMNFKRYESLMLPMLLLFLDLRGHERADGSDFVGGMSGGLFNNDLVTELRAVRSDESFSRRVAFAYLDGHQYADRMKSLGLFGGAERLPALAFNTNEQGVLAPYPERLPVERIALREFVAAFLSKRLRSRSDSDLFAVQKAKELSKPAFKAKRKPRRTAPAETVGVSEQFGQWSKGVEARGFADHVTLLTRANFTEHTSRHDLDVVVMFHATGCEKCANLAVYYKKVAERFADFKFPSLSIARFDVTDHASYMTTYATPEYFRSSSNTPPLEGVLGAGELPLLLFLPADDKQQPFTYYSGVAKVQPMMRWVAETAHIKFHLPDLCHLTPEDRDIYKIQVTEREVQRKADLAADLAEQLAEQARQDQYAQEQERGDDQAEDASADADGADCAADGTQAHAGKMEL